MFKRLVDLSLYEVLGITATVFFFIAFVALIIWVLFLKKGYINKMKNLPLESDDEEHTTAQKEQE